MAKFGMTYSLKIETEQDSNDFVDINMPFSIDFNIMRSINGSANIGSFTSYNLNENSRKKLYKDPYNQTFRAVQFFAGYNDGSNTVLPLLFNGFLKQGSSVRNGVNFLTTLEAYDGAWAMTQGQANQSTKSGQKLSDVLLGLMKDLPGIKGAIIGEGYDQENKRGQVILGNPVEYLKMISKNQFFIDKNHAYILNEKEILAGEIEEIDATTGIIGTPKKYARTIEVEMLFEPRITLCQKLGLTSTTFPEANGEYKVIEINHSGNISPRVASSVTTKLKLSIPDDSKLLRLVS